MKSVANRRLSFLVRLALPLMLVMVPFSGARAQMDPTGEWAPRVHEDWDERGAGTELGDYLGFPLNDAGRLRADSWEASIMELPENQCRPHGPDYEWSAPSAFRIWKDVDRATQQVIAYHTHATEFAEEQTIWMDGRPHPPEDAPHTFQGFSTGKWEGDILVVTTTHLKENWISRIGIMRSDKATITTHYMRHGNYLTVAMIIYDPIYWSEPFIQTRDLVYTPQQHIAPYNCVVVEEANRKPGVVPSYLLGGNPYLGDLSKHSGIPYEAIRGGSETLYPEYVEKLKAMMKKTTASAKLEKNP